MQEQSFPCSQCQPCELTSLQQRCGAIGSCIWRQAHTPHESENSAGDYGRWQGIYPRSRVGAYKRGIQQILWGLQNPEWLQLKSVRTLLSEPYINKSGYSIMINRKRNNLHHLWECLINVSSLFFVWWGWVLAFTILQLLIWGNR